MESVSWKLMSVAVYIISIIVWFALKDVSSCSVTPSAVAVNAGNNVSLTCTAGSDQILRWSRGIDPNSASVVYRAAVNSGKQNIPEILVDGYLVDGSVDSQMILTLYNASTVQADRYYCICYMSYSNAASVSVLTSKLFFSSSSQITDGEPVTFTCSMSFNGTAAASIAITDINGGYIAQDSKPGAYPSTSKDLQVISLDYSVIANSSVNQTYSCQINLTDNFLTIYSEQVVTSVHWITVDDHPTTDRPTPTVNGNPTTTRPALTVDGYPTTDRTTITVDGNQTTTRPALTVDGHSTTDILTTTVDGNPNTNRPALTVDGNPTTDRPALTVDGHPARPTDTPTQRGSESNSALIIGLDVGLGRSITIVTIIVLTAIIC